MERAAAGVRPGDVVLGRYEVVERLGSGGFAVVWRARDRVLGRDVALKQVTREHGGDDADDDRVLREGRSLASVAHPAVVAIHDMVVDGDTVWLVLEYVPGSTLDLRVAREGRRPASEVAALGATLAEALAHGHAGGLVHRDVKPANVLVDARRGTVKLADYGIARLVEGAGAHDVAASRQRHGSLPWASPEWARNEEVTEASDVFSLGATLFHAVEGRPPFADEVPGRALVLEVAAGRVLPAPHAGPLGDVLSRMLDPDPRARPAAAEVAATLAGLATADEGHDTAAAPTPPPVPPPTAPPPAAAPPAAAPPAAAPRSRRRLGIAGVALVLAAALVAGVLWAVGGSGAPAGDDPLTLPASGLRPVVDPGRDRDIDPCAVVDPAPLAAYGAATVNPGAYLSACTILLRRPGSSAGSRLVVDLLKGSDSTPADDRRPIGAGYLVRHPATEGCRATVTLENDISIIFRTLSDDGAVDPCRLLDGAVALAVRGLNAHGLLSRPGRTTGWPLALVDACTLATPASLAPVGLAGQVAGPQSSGWGRWDCRWGRDVAGGASVELALRLEDPDDALGRGPLALVAGRTVVTEVGDGDLNPRRCTTGVLWRPVANPPGLVQVIEAKVDAPGADARLCRAATGVVSTAADLLDARPRGSG